MRLEWLLVPALVGSVEIALEGPRIPPKSTWTCFYSFDVPGRPESVEVDVDISVYRTGVLGSMLDVFKMVLPSNFSVSVRVGKEDMYMQSFNTSIARISVVVPGKGSPVSLCMQNSNTFFPIQTVVSGEIVLSSNQFDLRSEFPDCPFPVYSQQMCGACYADVVAGAGTDDLCFSNGGKPIATKLSPQSIISCAGLGGCAGGSPYLATIWTQNTGLVEAAQCPYMSGTCAPQNDRDKDGCVDCKSLHVPNFSQSYKFRPVIIFSASEFAIRRHIEQRGSVMVIFIAHANFQEFFYAHPSGIYDSIANSPSIGNHAVRLIGFGIEGDRKYWIAMNSWGNSWGNRGAFKILRGENLCLIEQYPVGIEHMAYPEAGMANGEIPDYPQVGDWKVQDKHSPFWEDFINRNQQSIGEECKVVGIETKISNGYHVKILCQQGKVHLHVSPSGQVVTSKSGSVQAPEKSSPILVH